MYDEIINKMYRCILPLFLRSWPFRKFAVVLCKYLDPRSGSSVGGLRVSLRERSTGSGWKLENRENVKPAIETVATIIVDPLASSIVVVRRFRGSSFESSEIRTLGAALENWVEIKSAIRWYAVAFVFVSRWWGEILIFQMFNRAT